jgi:hypothetical protein
MADHGEVQYSTADGNDYPTHEQTYALFLNLTKWTVLLVVMILFLMFIFLV